MFDRGVKGPDVVRTIRVVYEENAIEECIVRKCFRLTWKALHIQDDHLNALDHDDHVNQFRNRPV